MTILRIQTATISATVTSSACNECGTIQKSGKMSCCGRGGSWFGNCGNAGNAKFGHTFYQGIQVCKARQSEFAVVQQLHGLQPKRNNSFDNTSMGMNSKVVVVGKQIFAAKRATSAQVSFMSAAKGAVTTQAKLSISKSIHSDPADMFMSTSSHTSASSARERDILLHTVIFTYHCLWILNDHLNIAE